MWLVCALLSGIFTVLNWVWTAKEHKKARRALVCALSFGVLTLLMEYRQIFNWVGREDWSALMDVVPATFSKLVGYVILLLVLNWIPFFLQQREK